MSTTLRRSSRNKLKSLNEPLTIKTENIEPILSKKKTKKTNKKPKDIKVEVKKEPVTPLKSSSGRKRKNVSSSNKIKDEESSPEKVIKSVQVKGKAPVDHCCSLKKTYHVYYDENEIWDCMLNQTNIQNNNNKYYLIQLLQSDGGKSYQVWMRWGRVGYGGQNSLTNCGSSLDKAKKVFEAKFLAKTKNNWNERHEFEKYPNKYDLVQLDYNTDDIKKEPEDEVDAKVPKKEIKIPDSSLNVKVQDLIKMVCDIRTMEQTVIEMQYDTKKAPLGKITNEQLRAGYEALNRISEILGRSSKSGLLQACNDFYTRIPHEFGFRVPPMINTLEMVRNKIQLLEALGDIQVAMKILNDKEDMDMNPIDRQYKQLQVDISPVDKKEDDFKLLENYIQSTHATTHSAYKMEVMDIFDCQKEKEKERFVDKGNRMLLFHGSRLSNYAGILSQGLRIAPPEAPSTGYMFGKGVYFADMSSKSANYCWPTPTNNVGLIMLCEVSLGTPNELVQASYTANKLPKGKHSVKGLGRTIPDPTKFTQLSDGTVVPMGPSIDNGRNDLALRYNEYIVYNTAQIKTRYLCKIKFNYQF